MRATFMSANLVGAASGWAARTWQAADAATNASMKPIATFGERFGAVVAAAVGAGFADIDLWTAHLHPRWATAEHVALARAQLGCHGMRVSSLAGSFGAEPSELDACCRLAISLDTSLLGGNAPMLASDRGAALTLLRDHGLVLAIENHPGTESVEDVLRAIGDDGDLVAAAADTGWFATAGIDPIAAIRRLFPHLRHVHLKDVLAGDDHAQAAYGDGIVDVRGVAAALLDLGYGGPLAIEHHPLDHDPMPALVTMRQLVARLIGRQP